MQLPFCIAQASGTMTDDDADNNTPISEEKKFLSPDELKFTNSSQKLKSNLISDVRAIYERCDNSIQQQT